MQFFMASVLIAFLPSSFLKLQATVTGPVSADGENAAPVCQRCCQGPAAVPGIPGVPGQPGQSGSKGDVGFQGQKGNMGDKGAKGEPGARGNAGLKGDAGIGLPGKVGPIGPPGLSGPRGETGAQGQKGEPGAGEAPNDSPNRRVAFTVVRRSSYSSDGAPTRLPFEEIMTRLPGTDFDLETGTFTCHVPGTYVFTFSLFKDDSKKTLNAHLNKNSDLIFFARTDAEGDDDLISGSAVLVLRQEDSVYLTVQGTVWDHTQNDYNLFSGFLLYAED